MCSMSRVSGVVQVAGDIGWSKAFPLGIMPSMPYIRSICRGPEYHTQCDTEPAAQLGPAWHINCTSISF
jgi:hypothetical protein